MTAYIEILLHSYPDGSFRAVVVAEGRVRFASKRFDNKAGAEALAEQWIAELDAAPGTVVLPTDLSD